MNHPHRKPFLQQVAEIYAAESSRLIADCCFIFPNKRSATFFRRFLGEALKGRNIHFTTETISSFVAEFSPLKEASRYDQIFTLFNEYRKILGNDSLDFDSFVFWGEMLIADFNDVDRYLVDPDRLFVNISRFKEISSNYLTDDQKEAIRRYWGEEPTSGNVDDFWKHVHADRRKDTKEKFLKLWETLGPLYHAFKKSLAQQGLTTSGALYRNAAEVLRNINRERPLRYSRYVFIGFNVLTTAEMKIFEVLKTLGAADFYWDFNSPAFANGFNRASRFIERNAAEFPSLHELEEETITTLPEIEIVGVPGNTAQTKYAGNILASWVGKKIISNPENAIDTAVVLPDEGLFVPLLHSIPEDIDSVNVTMGLPMRHNPLAALMHSIISMQCGTTRSHGEITFFHEHVTAIISSPLIKAIAPEECAALAEAILKRRLYRVPVSETATICPTLTFLFSVPADEEHLGGIFNYLKEVMDRISRPEERIDGMEQHFVAAYRQKLDLIEEACMRHGIEMRGKTLFRMIERAVAADKFHFAGEPLRGLQIMGVLETRSLDFDNVIMLSMNERIFPRRHYSGSFIPDTLRRGYGMATTDFQESIFAYYFYRLISRARHVSLIYDARTIGTSTGEMSRYIAQLLYLFGKGKISHRIMKFDIHAEDRIEVKVDKTPEVMEKMSRFTTGGKGSRNLSATAINTYIKCPLNFYLRFVERYDPDNEVNDYMDSSTYGTIVHAVMETIFVTLRGQAAQVTVTKEMLDRYIKSAEILIDPIVTSAINEHYNHRPAGDMRPLVGEALILGRVIRESVVRLLEKESELTPFVFMEAEEEIVISYKVNDRLAVNIRQFIDRVDQRGDTIRLIDYKTGSDNLEAKSVEQLFGHSDKNVKAFLQLMLYCVVYSIAHHYDGPIQPIIYSFRNIAKEGIVPLKLDKVPLEDYRPYAPEFEQLLKEKIEEIFNPDIPFVQAEDESACKYCNFWRICGRG